MKFRVIPTRQFAKDFKKIKDKGVQKAIKNKVNEVSDDPTRYKHLHYGLKDSFRIRVGSYRIIHSIDVGLNEMYLEKIVFRHNY